MTSHDRSGVTLCFHRLAVINPSLHGMQPFTSFGVTSICNGEIYNYKDLCGTPLRSDVEVINLVLSSTEGSLRERLRRLDGDFAFFAILEESGMLIAARDPVGVRPLFYGVDVEGDALAFASEVKSLLGLPGVEKVMVFPPGHCWTSSDGFQVYTDIYSSSQPIRENTDVKNNLRVLLTEAVKKRLMHSDVPVALLCSGGLDSSLVLAIAAQLLPSTRLHVFSIEFREGRSADALYASMVARHLGVQHTRVEFTMDDVGHSLKEVVHACESYDPNTIRAAMPMYLLARHIRAETPFKVILSGEGADEVFCGYNYFGRASEDSQVSTEAERLVRNIHMFDLLRADRCFAAFGLELRVPFLDLNLLRYAMGLPGRLRGFQNGVEKALLRDSFRDLDALSCARIIDRQKERLSDGCGYTYVPRLLTWLGNDANSLEKKLDAEKARYKATFDSSFPGHWHLITERKLPEWVRGNGVMEGTNVAITV